MGAMFDSIGLSFQQQCWRLIFAEPIIMVVESEEFGLSSLDNFLTSLDNAGSTVYKFSSLVDGRVLSGL